MADPIWREKDIHRPLWCLVRKLNSSTFKIVEYISTSLHKFQGSVCFLFAKILENSMYNYYYYDFRTGLIFVVLDTFWPMYSPAFLRYFSHAVFGDIKPNPLFSNVGILSCMGNIPPLKNKGLGSIFPKTVQNA